MKSICTRLIDIIKNNLSEIKELKDSVTSGNENPFEVKKILGGYIVTELYDAKYSESAKKSFENITINKNIPDEIDTFKAPTEDNLHLPKVFTELGITKSNSEARRLITAGSFKIEDHKFTDLDIKTTDLLNKTLQLGKRTFFTFN